MVEHLAYPIFRPIVRKGYMFPEHSTRTLFTNDIGAPNPSFCRVSVFDGFRTAFSWVSEQQHPAMTNTDVLVPWEMVG